MAGYRSLWLLVVVGVVLGVVLVYQFMGPATRPVEVVYAEPLDAYTVFALDLVDRIGLGEENTAVSPLSVYIALLMLTEGAAGDTRAELLKALHLSSVDDARTWFKNVLEDVLKVEEPARTSIANSIWVQNGFPVNKNYVDILEKYYLAETKHVDFKNDPVGAADAINEWVRNKTYGLIKQIIDPSSIDDMTRIILVNTIYFYANWTKPFQEIVPGEFHSPKGDVTVDYLKGRMGVYLLETPDYTAVALSYKGTDIKFVVIMPNHDNLKEFVKNLDKDELLNIFNKLFSSKLVTVRLYIPKFDVDSGIISLKKVLQEMGIKSAFRPDKADFSPMVEGNKKILYVKDVFHRARVRIGLKGTEAAAATAIIMELSAVPENPDIKTIRIDKPFLFFLLEPENNAILFAGSIVDPQQL